MIYILYIRCPTIDINLSPYCQVFKAHLCNAVESACKYARGHFDDYTGKEKVLINMDLTLKV